MKVSFWRFRKQIDFGNKFKIDSHLKGMFLPIRITWRGYSFIPLGWCKENSFYRKWNLVTVLNVDFTFGYKDNSYENRD